MDWQDAKSLIVEALGYDGATSKSLDTTTVGSATDIRLQLLLRNFSIETYSFFTRATPVTFIDGDWEGVDLTDFSRCTLSMAKILSLNLNGQMLSKQDGVGVLSRQNLTQGDTSGIPTKATPIAWAESDLGKIDFDCPLSMTGNPPAWCMGWYRHPVLTYDSASSAVAAGKSAKLGTCQLDETLVIPYAKYASVFLSESVTSVQAAMERLKRYDTQSFNLILQKRGENIGRYTRGLYGKTPALGWDANWWWGR